jgi:hypothetical protein
MEFESAWAVFFKESWGLIGRFVVNRLFTTYLNIFSYSIAVPNVSTWTDYKDQFPHRSSYLEVVGIEPFLNTNP